MSRIESSISVDVPQDVDILERLDLSMEKEGLVILLKSSIIENWAKTVSKGNTFHMEEYSNEVPPGVFYKIPNAMLQRTNMQPRFRTEPASVYWIAAVGLGEGIKIVHPQPVLEPGDLVQYAHSACDQVKDLYMVYIRKDAVHARVKEVFRENR